MKKIAVILSGCGHLDGAEIRESTMTILSLDKREVRFKAYAPNVEQSSVVDHLVGKEVQERGNTLTEAARIMRGDIRPLEELDVDKFDGLIIPGGGGVAKNLTKLAYKRAEAEINQHFKKAVLDFYEQKKPILGICIAPAAIALCLKDKTQVKITLGTKNEMFSFLNAEEEVIENAEDYYYDERNRILSTPAYMLDARISNIAIGIDKAVSKLLELC